MPDAAKRPERSGKPDRRNFEDPAALFEMFAQSIPVIILVPVVAVIIWMTVRLYASDLCCCRIFFHAFFPRKITCVALANLNTIPDRSTPRGSFRASPIAPRDSPFKQARKPPVRSDVKHTLCSAHHGSSDLDGLALTLPKSVLERSDRISQALP